MNKTILFILIIFGCGCFQAQTNADAQLWGYLRLEKEIGKRASVYLNLKGRLINNMMVPGRGATHVGFGYKFSKNIRSRIEYAYVQKLRDNGSFAPRHQVRASLFLKAEVDHWSFIYRNMVQARSKGFFDESDNNNIYFYDRNKFTVKYDLSKRFTVYGAGEVYIPLNDPQVKGISRSRTFAGTLINITKKQQLDLFFMYQAQIQKGNWYDHDISYPNEALAQKFVYGIGYNIQF